MTLDQLEAFSAAAARRQSQDVANVAMAVRAAKYKSSDFRAFTRKLTKG